MTGNKVLRSPSKQEMSTNNSSTSKSIYCLKKIHSLKGQLHQKTPCCRVNHMLVSGRSWIFQWWDPQTTISSSFKNITKQKVVSGCHWLPDELSIIWKIITGNWRIHLMSGTFWTSWGMPSRKRVQTPLTVFKCLWLFSVNNIPLGAKLPLKFVKIYWSSFDVYACLNLHTFYTLSLKMVQLHWGSSNDYRCLWPA